MALTVGTLVVSPSLEHNVEMIAELRAEKSVVAKTKTQKPVVENVKGQKPVVGMMKP